MQCVAGQAGLRCPPCNHPNGPQRRRDPAALSRWSTVRRDPAPPCRRLMADTAGMTETPQTEQAVAAGTASQDVLIPAQGVLFDCDGVLVESDASVAAAWSRWAVQYGFDPAIVGDIVHGRRAVVTSGNRVLATARLAAAGIPSAAVVITADDVADGKPHPEGYRAAARLIGLSPEQTVVLEDAMTGVLAARAAGVSAV